MCSIRPVKTTRRPAVMMAMVLLAAVMIQPALAAPGDRETSTGRPDRNQTRVAYIQQQVGDLERAVAFYTKGLGMRVTRDYQNADASFREISVAFEDNPNATAIILTWRRGEERPLKSDWPIEAVLQVRNLEASLAAVEAAGGVVTRRMAQSGAGIHRAEIVDPDGQPVELRQVDPAPSASGKDVTGSNRAAGGRPSPGAERIAHLRLAVWNFDRAVKFYTEVLGMTATPRAAEGTAREANLAYDDNPDATSIILVRANDTPAASSAQTPPLHAILQVQNIEAFVRRVAMSEGRIISRQVFGPSTKLHFLDALRDNDGIAVNGFIQDPEGYQVELLEMN